MIKLNIEDPVQKKQEFLEAILPGAMLRVDNLKVSLGHLLRMPIDVDYHIASIKTVTRDAIDIIEGKKYEGGSYDKAHYIKTVQGYLASSSSEIGNVNIQGLYDLLDELLAGNAEKLAKLLVYPADELSHINNAFVARIGIPGGKEEKLVRLGFDYSYLSADLKKFFNDADFIQYCPYCNLEQVDVLRTEEGADATVHHLDHFYSQTDHPFLSFSMFNLVPSGDICNSKNKGALLFSSVYHLNPYIGGFGKNMRFVPEEIGGKVTGIKLALGCEPGSNESKRLIGDGDIIKEDSPNGNINVFKLQTKYSDREHRRLASAILARIRHADSGIRSISKYLEAMDAKNPQEIHLEWYERAISTSFYSGDFGEMKDSKLNRDLHDYYFETNKGIISGHFEYVRDMLERY